MNEIDRIFHGRGSSAGEVVGVDDDAGDVGDVGEMNRASVVQARGNVEGVPADVESRGGENSTEKKTPTGIRFARPRDEDDLDDIFRDFESVRDAQSVDLPTRDASCRRVCFVSELVQNRVTRREERRVSRQSSDRSQIHGVVVQRDIFRSVRGEQSDSENIQRAIDVHVVVADEERIQRRDDGKVEADESRRVRDEESEKLEEVAIDADVVKSRLFAPERMEERQRGTLAAIEGDALDEILSDADFFNVLIDERRFRNVRLEMEHGSRHRISKRGRAIEGIGMNRDGLHSSDDSRNEGQRRNGRTGSRNFVVVHLEFRSVGEPTRDVDSDLAVHVPNNQFCVFAEIYRDVDQFQICDVFDDGDSAVIGDGAEDDEVVGGVAG